MALLGMKKSNRRGGGHRVKDTVREREASLPLLYLQASAAVITSAYATTGAPVVAAATALVAAVLGLSLYKRRR
ncbi:hypothetical protein [Streptomyces hirsutus]|uniref:hypothetical protein n=1 Tax=Streptomyces hirsutus TaxID=35620 RepID=UPI0011467557|nr:hypothetical protein [Streptomyces hirsutus]